tara:strand:+ start:101 stop:826 length:726 start_codon:yes stop_codon:yes gene_type:complete
MKYMGSKNKIAKRMLPIILKDRVNGQFYVEPFVGGANMIDKVSGNRIGGEFNIYIASMWKALESGYTFPFINKDEYKKIKNNMNDYDPALVGWVGVCCSYSGKWFGGYAGKVETKGGTRDYQAESFANVKKQMLGITGINFVHSSYDELTIPHDSIIYCDPPYRNTTQYKDSFDSDHFFEWCRSRVRLGDSVFISEYTAPEDFVCVWSQDIKSSLSANGKCGKSKNSTERLFIHHTQATKA